MRLRSLTGFVAAALLVLGLASPAAGDAVYHSERLGLTGGSAGFHGQVVNIHANGPVVGALERYQVIGADPSTTYDVWIQVCDGDAFTDFLTTTSLVTDEHGNGHARASFSADDLVPFSGAVINIRWVLKDGGTIEYWTRCTIVTID